MFRPERIVRYDRKMSELSSDSETEELKVRTVRRGRGPEQPPPAESRELPSLDSLYRAAAELDGTLTRDQWIAREQALDPVIGSPEGSIPIRRAGWQTLDGEATDSIVVPR